MLKPDKDRLDYGELLCPPEGYQLEKAVGTTYSLDLKALMAACISLGIGEETDEVIRSDEVLNLLVMQKVSEKVVVFCEGGQIKCPRNNVKALDLLDRMVFEVNLDAKKYTESFPAFHPKVWVLCFSNKGNAEDKRWRLIIQSRNLTFDRCWDVSAALDGVQTNQEDRKSVPLIDFLRFLLRQLKDQDGYSHDRRDLILNMIHELKTVHFELTGSMFKDFEILPRFENQSPPQLKEIMVNNRFHELVIVSPFLSKTVIDDFHDGRNLGSGKPVLITTKQSLRELQGKKGFQTYIMKDDVVFGEGDIGDQNPDYQQQDIHAKMYFLRKGKQTDFMLGSMNATYNGLNCNTEMMLLLKSASLTAKQLMDDLFGNDPDRNPFRQADEGDVPKEDKIENVNLKNTLKKVCRLGWKAEVNQSDNEYAVVIQAEKKFAEMKIDRKFILEIAPFSSGIYMPLHEMTVFEHLDIDQLSEFYRLRITDPETKQYRQTVSETVMKIPTKGIPRERDTEIVRRILDRDKVKRYISLALSDDYGSSVYEDRQNSGSGSPSHQQRYMPAVYEQMLKAAAKEPQKLYDLAFILPLLDETDADFVEFKKLYELYRKILKK